MINYQNLRCIIQNTEKFFLDYNKTRLFQRKEFILEKVRKNIPFTNLLEIVREMPLWILQGLYIEVSGLLKDKGNTLNLSELDRLDMFQLYVPNISKLGERLLEHECPERKLGKIDPNIIKFLETTLEGKNIIDICITNNWTLEECAKIIYECMENNYVDPTWTPSVHTAVLFIAGRIKIGEFLLRKNKITNSQLEWALQLQTDMNTTFEEKVKIVEILVNLGYIKREEVADHLNLKELSKTNLELKDFTQPYVKRINDLENSSNDLGSQLAELTQKYEVTHKEKLKFEKEVEELKEKVVVLNEKSLKLQDKITEYEKSIFKKL